MKLAFFFFALTVSINSFSNNISSSVFDPEADLTELPLGTQVSLKLLAKSVAHNLVFQKGKEISLMNARVSSPYCTVHFSGRRPRRGRINRYSFKLDKVENSDSSMGPYLLSITSLEYDLSREGNWKYVAVHNADENLFITPKINDLYDCFGKSNVTLR